MNSEYRKLLALKNLQGKQLHKIRCLHKIRKDFSFEEEQQYRHRARQSYRKLGISIKLHCSRRMRTGSNKNEEKKTNIAVAVYMAPTCFLRCALEFRCLPD